MAEGSIKKRLICIAAVLLFLTCLAVAEERNDKWQAMYGTFDTTEGVLTMIDYQYTAGGKSYVYYDEKKDGDISCCAAYRITEQTTNPAFTLRLEKVGDYSHSVHLTLQGDTLTLSVYEGEEIPARQAVRKVMAAGENELKLTYQSKSQQVIATLNGQNMGSLLVSGLDGGHRFRLDFDEPDPLGRSSCEIIYAFAEYGKERLNMIVLPKTITLDNDTFHVTLDVENKALSSLSQPGDSKKTEYLSGKIERKPGQVIIRYTNGDNTDIHAGRVVRTDNNEAKFDWDNRSINMNWEQLGRSGLSAAQKWELTDNTLVWKFSVTNTTDQPIRLCDIQLPLNFNTNFEKNADNYNERVLRHHFCSWDGSFAYWTRPSGEGDCLVMVPQSGTQLEYYDQSEGFSMYIHAQYTGNNTEGEWAYPFTSLVLQPGETKEYGMNFCWAEGEQGIRNALYEMNGINVISLPGMTVAKGMDAQLALRTKDEINELIAPEGCTITPLGQHDDYRIFNLAFAEIGEQRIEVRFGNDRRVRLDYFATESLDKLIPWRTEHLVNKQQYRGDKWYDGLFTQWCMDTMRATSPEDPQNLHTYIVRGADDPCLGKAPLIAQKNVYKPVREEIEAVEYYIEHFVWGKLQRTDKEVPRPYAIYGSDSWYENRNSGTGFNNGGHDEDRMWRTFDYTHIVQLYYYMYQVAHLYPDQVEYLDADGYLMRAFHTAEAYFEVPISIFMEGWDFHGYCSWAFMQGNFGETVIVQLIDALDQNGYTQEAEKLRGYWETKVKYMTYDEPYPFGSEMVFDTTAFESTHAIAKYGMEHDVAPDDRGFYDPNAIAPGKGAYLPAHEKIEKKDFLQFMEREQKANRAARCEIEPAYNLLGSDLRGSNMHYMLTYMTQLGASGLLDTALNYSENTAEGLRLAYASYMAGWMQIHSGESYEWYADELNRGAAAWGFQPTRGISPWCFVNPVNEYGIWTVDGEIDCGFSGGLRIACSVLVDDPVFGRFYYGGCFKEDENRIKLYPADGVEQRLYIRTDNLTVDLLLERDGIKEAVINGDCLILKLENRTGDVHTNCIVLKNGDETRQTVVSAPAESEYEVMLLLNHFAKAE